MDVLMMKEKGSRVVPPNRFKRRNREFTPSADLSVEGAIGVSSDHLEILKRISEALKENKQLFSWQLWMKAFKKLML